MLYMVVERFRRHDAGAIYARLRECGRMLPEGLRYVDSWIESNCDRCFQLMETDNPALFDVWLAAWSDLMEFEIVPVSTSAEMRARFS